MMQRPDYEALGLKVGLEIHQQLDTNKLFCRCSSIIREDTPDLIIKRILRASAGETGDVDIAAKAEVEKKKYFIYQAYTDSNCLVELDESPAEEINEDALKIVLQLAKILDADVVDQVHVMRKTVVDGSNTTGFQRTALIARNGSMEVELEQGQIIDVKIDTLCLEEDAARIIEKNKDFDVYRLDRLGIPLIEIATGPDMHSPMQAKNVAAHIGMLLRSTGRVKRGLGTIRQDVNVSIFGGARAEIKGVQDLRLIDKVVELEVERQLNLIRLREEMSSRGIEKENIIAQPKDYSEYFMDTQSKFIKKGLDSGEKMYGKPYNNFKGLFGFMINPDRRFGTELSDRIKLLGLNGLIHTDEELEKYKILDIVKVISSDLHLEYSDAMIFILGTDDRCIAAFKRIDDAIKDFLENGLSKEVRNAKDDATSVFLRPMPGSSRMYPETDVPTLVPDLSGIEKPELIKDKIIRFGIQYALPKQVAKELVFEGDFEYFVEKYPQVKPMAIAEGLVSMPKEIKTRYGKDVNISHEQYDQIFMRLNSGDIAKEAVFEILLEIASNEQGEKIDFSKYQTSEDEVSGYITEMISEHPQFNSNAIMGLVMKQYRGKYSGQKILELIKKFKGE